LRAGSRGRSSRLGPDGAGPTDSVALIGTRTLGEPLSESALDLLLARPGELSPEVLPHERDARAVELEGDAQAFRRSTLGGLFHGTILAVGQDHRNRHSAPCASVDACHYLLEWYENQAERRE
jgi:hypothetical protein